MDAPNAALSGVVLATRNTNNSDTVSTCQASWSSKPPFPETESFSKVYENGTCQKFPIPSSSQSADQVRIHEKEMPVHYQSLQTIPVSPEACVDINAMTVSGSNTSTFSEKHSLDLGHGPGPGDHDAYTSLENDSSLVEMNTMPDYNSETQIQTLNTNIPYYGTVAAHHPSITDNTFVTNHSYEEVCSLPFPSTGDSLVQDCSRAFISNLDTGDFLDPLSMGASVEASATNVTSVMELNSLSHSVVHACQTQEFTMNSFNKSFQASPAMALSSSTMNQTEFGKPLMNLSLSHLIQAAEASPFSSIDSPMSNDTYSCDADDSRSQQGTPDPDMLFNHKPQAGPRRKKLWLLDEEAAGKEPLNNELRNGLRILKEIMSDINKSLNWPFMNPVDPDQDGVEDYYEKIENPMWLKKIREKFDERVYTTITEFVLDFRMMLENCYRYNGPDHPISKRGQRLETVLEQKLALLSREMREKTSIEATSGRPAESSQFVTGTRRRKALVPHDSTALLNQLRMEQQEKVKEVRKQQVLDRKQAHEQFVRELDDWEDSLFETPETKQEMRAMWEIPQVGHFLFLCLCPYDLGEVMHWELERSFLIPRESSTMQRVMTSLLSTPYQRTRLEKKPPMPYKVWEEKLRRKLNSWYQTLRGQQGDVVKTCNKLGLEDKFFKVVGMKNPLAKKRFHELSVYQRVWIVKALCDYCLEHQESMREAIEAVQPVEDQNTYLCGTDADGNTYLHFPQFCGADVRLYRQATIKYPKLDIPKAESVMRKAKPRYRPSPKKKKRKKKKVPTATLR